MKYKITYLLDRNQKGWCQSWQCNAALKNNIELTATECAVSVADPSVIPGVQWGHEHIRESFSLEKTFKIIKCKIKIQNCRQATGEPSVAQSHTLKVQIYSLKKPCTTWDNEVLWCCTFWFICESLGNNSSFYWLYGRQSTNKLIILYFRQHLKDNSNKSTGHHGKLLFDGQAQSSKQNEIIIKYMML